jgi:SAM-dependent methyltransferase
VADRAFEDPQLVALYDPLDPDRSDLLGYAGIVAELRARSVLDIGCGTGTFASLLAQCGVSVIGLEPAEASLEIARTKPYADHVTWIHGTAADLPSLQVDLVTMTANVAQVFLTDEEWFEALTAILDRLVPGGRLVFETRVPQCRAWDAWTPEETTRTFDVDGDSGRTWTEVLRVEPPLVTFRQVFAFAGARRESVSTLRFRQRDEIESALTAAGFVDVEVRDAADRPGREWIFLARRP